MYIQEEGLGDIWESQSSFLIEGSLDFFKGLLLYSFPQQRHLFSPLFGVIKGFYQNGDVRYLNPSEYCGPENLLNLVSGGGDWG